MKREIRQADADDARDPRLTAALRDALAMQEAGLATEKILAHFPEFSEALLPLLAAAAQLRQLPTPPATEGLTRRIDAALVAAEAERRPARLSGRIASAGAGSSRRAALDRAALDRAVPGRTALGRTALDPAVPGHSLRSRLLGLLSQFRVLGEQVQASPWAGLGRRPVLGLAGLVLAFGLVCAGTARASAGSLPGSPLYPLKRAVETLRLDLAPAAQRAILAYEQAERRLSEAAALRDLGRSPAPALAELLSLGAWREDLSPEALAAFQVAEGEAEARAAAGRGMEDGGSSPAAGGSDAGRASAFLGFDTAGRSLAPTPIVRLGSPAALISAAEAARIARLAVGPAASARRPNGAAGSSPSASGAPGRAGSTGTGVAAGAVDPREPASPAPPPAVSPSPSGAVPPPPDDDDDDDGPAAPVAPTEASTATPEPPSASPSPTASPSPASSIGGPDPGFGIIEGLVLGGVNAAPLPDAQVFFVDAQTGDRIGEERSDAEGRFRRRLPRGRYLVTALAENHFQQWHEGKATRELADIIGISGDGSILKLKFRLKPLTASGGP